ncbi:flavin-containing monooxygenase [Nocardioides sp. Kera G14]|uniref:flavin-containing monooxygenase n=1 Tax=Nocardioides sp. Kera G14 TaxID=2884264 RepID=UPI001D10ECCB|nr:NAD(P)/FAD-dependent oxidoreductase [Nocardioides sp. Kera G14]UDY25013.1 NAD(P)/FAD-dependent oxidoreductase [Nocardioides sp. Kera G14]
MRNPHSGAPFGETEREVAAYLADLSVPALLLSCVHMAEPSARSELLRGKLRPAGAMLNEFQGFMPEEDQEAARALALQLVLDWQRRGFPEPEPVDAAMLQEMMNFAVGGAVGPEYVPMMAEELELDGLDQRATGLLPGASGLPAIVIGCGMSGLLAAIRLKEAGFPIVVIEKNEGPGGTWWENTYPGARVDVANHFYCYSFEPADHWTEYFARQPELRAYFEQVMHKHGIDEHVRFGREALEATWDEEANRWRVRLDDGSEVEGAVLVSAVGQLNRPNVPDVPGHFDGPAFHTSRWRHDVDLAGKDVVMVGAGATGFQAAPAIADTVGSLTVIQRTAQWMFPNPGYHDAVGPGVGWAIRHLPFYGRWFRFLIFWGGCDAGIAAAEVDPAWEAQERSVSEVNEIVRTMFTDWIVGQLEGRDDLVAKVVPDYPPTGKRTLQDNGSWLGALKRDNVELVRAGVARLEADGVVDTDGVHHRADVLIWATGFRPNDFLMPMRVTGRDGVDLHEFWGRRPRAHLGVTVPGFPNLFLLYGPGTNLASGGSIIFASECEVRMMMGCLQILAEASGRSIEVRPEVVDEYDARLREEMGRKVWASPHIRHNYYRNDAGEVVSLNPFRLVDYWGWTKDVSPAEYVVGT